MSMGSLSTIIFAVEILMIALVIWGIVKIVEADHHYMTALLFGFSVVSFLVNDLYWLAYVSIRPNTRLPFAVDEISNWAVFLLLSEAVLTAFDEWKSRDSVAYDTGFGKDHKLILKMALTVIFTSACMIYWIGWSGEWLQDIISGIVCAYMFCVIVRAMHISGVLSRAEWALFGSSALVLGVMQGLTFLTEGSVKETIDFFCYVIMFISIAAFLAKVLIVYRDKGGRSGASGMLSISAGLFCWCISCMYMSAEPMYFVPDIMQTVTLFFILYAVKTGGEIK